MSVSRWPSRSSRSLRGRALALRYWTEVYPHLSADYVTRDCHEDGPLDRTPKDGQRMLFSATLDNGIELFGTHEEGENGIEYRITRLEALPKPT